MDLDEILLDDPNFSELKGKPLQKKIQEFREEYLEPLKCVDKYLLELKGPAIITRFLKGVATKTAGGYKRN